MGHVTVLPELAKARFLEGFPMKLMLMACIFFAGVYLGLHTDPEGELSQVIGQIQALINGEPEW